MTEITIPSKKKLRQEFFTLRASRRGGDELRTSVYPSNFAPIARKLRERVSDDLEFSIFRRRKKQIEDFFRFFSFVVVEVVVIVVVVVVVVNYFHY